MFPQVMLIGGGVTDGTCCCRCTLSVVACMKPLSHSTNICSALMVNGGLPVLPAMSFALYVSAIHDKICCASASLMVKFFVPLMPPPPGQVMLAGQFVGAVAGRLAKPLDVIAIVPMSPPTA